MKWQDDIVVFVLMEEYPSPAEGIGLENRQAGYTARGFESLFLRHLYSAYYWRSSKSAALGQRIF